jgi:hypothetical protein
MKTFLTIIAFIGMAKQCSKLEPYHTLDMESHPDYVHKMELTLAEDLNSDDSATAGWAKKFLTEFETGFNGYHPDKSVIEQIKKKCAGLTVKVIGGNWCSDTREQIPRLCKVLYYAQVPASTFEYYRVSRDKKPVADDFAATRTIGAVPEIVIFVNGEEKGRIIEVPQKNMEEDLLRILKLR